MKTTVQVSGLTKRYWAVTALDEVSQPGAARGPGPPAGGPERCREDHAAARAGRPGAADRGLGIPSPQPTSRARWQPAGRLPGPAGSNGCCDSTAAPVHSRTLMLPHPAVSADACRFTPDWLYS